MMNKHKEIRELRENKTALGTRRWAGPPPLDMIILKGKRYYKHKDGADGPATLPLYPQ